jgi:glycosyltransferase involved in cell wall biosynthesis
LDKPMNEHVEVSDPGAIPKSPKVSIIVLAYQHEHYLAEAVESLAVQKAPFDYEIVIGEDASSDATRNVALALQRKYPHLVRVLYSERNRGMMGNFRFTLSHCRGEYLAGCEGDDFWIDEGKLARQVAALDAHPGVDMAFTRGYELYQDGSRIAGWDYGPQARIVTSREMFRGLGFIAPAASVVMRANIIHELPGWLDEAPVGDVFHYLAGSARGGAWYEPSFTVCYRIGQPTSFTVTHQERSHDERIAFFETSTRFVLRACAHYGVPRAVMADRLNEYRFQIVLHNYAKGNIAEALKNFAKLDMGFVLRGVGRRFAKLARGH